MLRAPHPRGIGLQVRPSPYRRPGSASDAERHRCRSGGTDTRTASTANAATASVAPARPAPPNPQRRALSGSTPSSRRHTLDARAPFHLRSRSHRQARKRSGGTACRHHRALKPPTRTSQEPPFLVLLSFVAYLGRNNDGFALDSLSTDIGLSATAFEFGAGMFFIL